MTVEEQWKAEVKQNDIDHHTPTAGAMTGHIVSNLRIQSNKLTQFEWYLKGATVIADRELIDDFRENVDETFIELGHQLVEWNEKPASTTSEWQEYSMLEEAGQNKYYSADEMIAMVVQDIQTSLMFVGRAIILANKEEKFGLAAYLMQVQTMYNHYNELFQARLGNEALTGFEEEDEDD